MNCVDLREQIKDVDDEYTCRRRAELSLTASVHL